MVTEETTAATGAAANSSILDEPVIYRDLKAWIEEQERNPKPLSPLQQKAISILLGPQEPDIGSRDWVSLLNLFNQAHGSGSSFTDRPAPGQKWLCQCVFRLNPYSAPMTFPGPEAGFVPDEKGTPAAPSFGRKKDAKQYAAKCCVEWLMKAGYMPSDGVSVESPKNKVRPAAAAAAVAVAAAAATRQASPTKAGTAAQAKPTAGNDGEDDDEPPVTKRVEELCRTLGLIVPQYKITPSAIATTTTPAAAADVDPSQTVGQQQQKQQQNPQHGFFDGYADFGPDSGIKVPEGLGRVTNVYGRKGARNRVAEEVLAWLRAEQGRREVEVEEMLSCAT
ncbi:hypothetical protein MYCTH_2304004 [Thermothelomyces thermophilus ATCC 42464]|uniref:DRBM domain-containing protein n=1 Tax=Thermothelomyces thermophilus (strain ATCC 42464 / BCRC 31852 / DSM 1799) TaxID=573729 RepID=G2QE47_THET4|nr:uncharacterized protein MYCTH_2304004 [Thermothelomyces thermophilus ATCC 42464]AEO57630.1 hypothetical protein MYCTH_2304004 [Thermothelomyces thermophilus ATCC 42464]